MEKSDIGFYIYEKMHLVKQLAMLKCNNQISEEREMISSNHMVLC